MPSTQQLTIVRGKTLNKVIRWEADPIVRKPITAISLATGAPVLTVSGHGCTNGWRAYVYDVLGMKQINTENNPPRMSEDESRSDWHESTVIDASTIEFNRVNPIDDNGKLWPAYVSGGFFCYYTARDLTSYTADVVVRDKEGGTVLLSSRLSDAPLNLLTATVDNATKTVRIGMSETDTAAILWKKGVWEVEMHGPSSVESLVALHDYDDATGRVTSTSEVSVVGEIVT